MNTLYSIIEIEATIVQMPVVHHAAKVGWASLPHCRKAEVIR